MSSAVTFKDHRVSAMIINVVLAITPVIILILLEYFVSLGLFGIASFLGVSFLLNFAHPIYLFFEIKHLINKDLIVDKPDLAAITVFGGLSLLGLVLQVFTIARLIVFLNLTSYSLLAIIPLSLAAALGGCLGLTDLTSFRALWLPILFKHLGMVSKSRNLIIVCLGTTILLTILTFLSISLSI